MKHGSQSCTAGKRVRQLGLRGSSRRFALRSHTGQHVGADHQSRTANRCRSEKPGSGLLGRAHAQVTQQGLLRCVERQRRVRSVGDGKRVINHRCEVHRKGNVDVTTSCQTATAGMPLAKMASRSGTTCFAADREHANVASIRSKRHMSHTLSDSLAASVHVSQRQRHQTRPRSRVAENPRRTILHTW